MFTKDDDLAFDINQAIDNLECAVKNLPQGATNADVMKCAYTAETIGYRLISAARIAKERCANNEENNSLHINLVDGINRFFSGSTARKASNN